MKTVYEVHHSWYNTSKFGGTQLDYDIDEGTEVVGRFETREAAESLMQQLDEKYSYYKNREEQDGRSWSYRYEVKEVEAASEPPNADQPR